MKRLLLLTPLMLVASCATAPTSGDAVCSIWKEGAARHAAALVDDGGDRSVLTGQNLIARMDAACGL